VDILTIIRQKVGPTGRADLIVDPPCSIWLHLSNSRFINVVNPSAQGPGMIMHAIYSDILHVTVVIEFTAC